MLVLGEDLQDRAGDAELPLDGLVRVGVRAESDRLADIALFRQLLPEELGGFRLREDAGLEVEAG